MIIKLIAKMITIKIVAIRGFVSKVVEINKNNMYIKIYLIEKNIKILLYLTIVEFKIWFFKTVITYLVFCLVIFVFEDKYPLILYYKFF